jgi:hypothetical protein
VHDSFDAPLRPTALSSPARSSSSRTKLVPPTRPQARKPAAAPYARRAVSALSPSHEPCTARPIYRLLPDPAKLPLDDLVPSTELAAVPAACRPAALLQPRSSPPASLGPVSTPFPRCLPSALSGPFSPVSGGRRRGCTIKNCNLI